MRRFDRSGFYSHFVIYATILTILYVCFSDERDAIQKKTFTKWVNKHLKKVCGNSCYRVFYAETAPRCWRHCLF
jgi:hypothetical protein